METIVHEKSYRPLEPYSEHGTAQATCLAGLLQASGHVKKFPDREFVAAFARTEFMRPGVVTTALGAAVSFMECGFEVRMLGPTSPSTAVAYGDLVSNWNQQLVDNCSAVRQFTPPSITDLDALVNPVDGQPWQIKLDVVAAAVGATGFSHHPVLLRDPVPGRDSRLKGDTLEDSTKLNVFDPQLHALDSGLTRPIFVADALRTQLNRAGGVSLLAVRRRQ